MEKSEIAKILEEVRANPDVVEELREQDSPGTLEEVAAVWTKAAVSLGHSVSEEEISAYIREAEEEMRRKAQDTKDEIETLSEQELEDVAGGKGHSQCQVSYKDKENCWIADGCDNVAVVYPGYKCHKLFEGTCKSFMG